MGFFTWPKEICVPELLFLQSAICVCRPWEGMGRQEGVPRTDVGWGRSGRRNVNVSLIRIFMKKFLNEFKEFAMRGNVVDMAVGVVIGAAFGKIVSSLVDDIIMPLVGVATGGMNFTDYKLVLQQAVVNGAEVIKPEVTMNWGAWVQTVVDFLIVAFCIFVMIKFINNMRKKMEKQQEAEAAVEEAKAEEASKEEQLLAEIRDLLKERK